MGKRKFIVRNRRKRKMLFSILFVLLFFIGVGYSALSTKLMIGGILDVSKAKTLYGVLENEAKIGTYATEYTGEHKDSFTETGTKKIYHWYAENNDEGIAIQNKNNVIFAGQCWQMIRTTDTGGVKLLYNGEAVNNQCLNTRSNHRGYSSSNMDLYSYYSYGTDYTYDSINNTFSLIGATTGEIKVSQYTCGTSSSSNCNSLYFVDSLVENSKYNVYKLSDFVPYYAISKDSFNTMNTPTSVGYMYNKDYEMQSLFKKQYHVSGSFVYPSSTNLYYSDSIHYDVNNSIYILDNPISVSSVSNYDSLIGKYVVDDWNSSDSLVSGSYANYILSFENNYFHSRQLVQGDLTISMTVGDSFVKNNDDTFTLQNPTFVSFLDFYNSSSYSNYYGKYFCEGNNSTCSSLKRFYYVFISGMDSSWKSNFPYVDSSDVYSYGENVSYHDGEYFLSGDVVSEWDYPSLSDEFLSTHHYMCPGSNTHCINVNYILDWESSTSKSFGSSFLRTVALDDGSNIEFALQNMLNVSNVNQNDSVIKKDIDKWYEDHLLSYSSYLEETVFCNDRRIDSLGVWNPNGGMHEKNMDIYAPLLTYKTAEDSTDISCYQDTDKFSISNSQAHLNYSVAVLSKPEMNLLGTVYGIRGFFSNKGLYTMTPSAAGSVYYYDNHDPYIRPVISLKSGTMFIEGDGSLSYPYYVGDSYSISLDSDIFHVKSKSAPGLTVSIQSDNYIVTSFKLNGTLVTGDSFVMPEEDVTITDIQYVQANYSITCNDNNVTVPSTGRYNSSITLVANTGVVSSFKLNGTLIEGNSFIMPAENVTITDVVIGTSITIESDHNPYVVNLNDGVYYENTFAGATSLTVELTYETDWGDRIELFDSSSATEPIRYGYFGTNLTTETITINSNYLKIKFIGGGSNTNYYGFKAIITPNYT